MNDDGKSDRSIVPGKPVNEPGPQGSGEESVVRRLVREGGLQAWQPESADYATYRDKRLDWILVSPELEIVDYRVVDDPISDHRLVVADLRWREP